MAFGALVTFIIFIPVRLLLLRFYPILREELAKSDKEYREIRQRLTPSEAPPSPVTKKVSVLAVRVYQGALLVMVLAVVASAKKIGGWTDVLDLGVLTLAITGLAICGFFFGFQVYEVLRGKPLLISRGQVLSRSEPLIFRGRALINFNPVYYLLGAIYLTLFGGILLLLVAIPALF